MAGTSSAGVARDLTVARNWPASAGKPISPALAWLDRRFTLFAVAPTVLLMLVVFGIPLTFSLFLSTQGWTIDQSVFAGRFVGTDNYMDLLTDPSFMRSVLLTLGYTAATVTAEMTLGLAVALLLNMNLRFIGFFRTTLIVPMMMTPIIAALCWKLLLDPRNGVVNYLLDSRIVWLGSPGTALFSVGLVNVWQNAPYVAILLLAGLRSLPSEPLEAASIDGASRLQTFRHVVLPLLQPYILVALLLRTIFEFRSFDNVYVMTSGGPADATMVLSIFTYMASFVRFDFSLGAAASWMMLAMALVMCCCFILALRRAGGVR
jgi:multiple sugar transport system permease protein